MKNIIACNLNSYGQFREGAYSTSSENWIDKR